MCLRVIARLLLFALRITCALPFLWLFVIRLLPIGLVWITRLRIAQVAVFLWIVFLVVSVGQQFI